MKLSLSPSKATCPCSQPSLAAAGRLPSATSNKGIFENLLNIFRNLIYILNTSKISYPRKLFPIILFSGIKIHSIYQTALGVPLIYFACSLIFFLLLFLLHVSIFSSMAFLPCLALIPTSLSFFFLSFFYCYYFD